MSAVYATFDAIAINDVQIARTHAGQLLSVELSMTPQQRRDNCALLLEGMGNEARAEFLRAEFPELFEVTA